MGTNCSMGKSRTIQHMFSEVALYYNFEFWWFTDLPGVQFDPEDRYQ